jgi:hypothetical protein
MGDTTRIRLRRYPRPPYLAHFLRVYFKLEESYDVPTALGRALLAAGDAVVEPAIIAGIQVEDGL